MLNDKFSKEEECSVERSKRLEETPDADDMDYLMLKNLSITAKQFLLDCYNEVEIAEYFHLTGINTRSIL